VILFLLWPTTAFAQDSTITPVEIQLTVDRATLDQGETCQTVLILHNTMPHTLTNVGAQLQGTSFKVANPADLPDTLAPYSSTQAEYTLKSQSDGSQNVIFAVQYTWDDPDTGMARHRIETAAATGIEVLAPSGINWPDYLIPLLLGFAIGQLGAWFTDWRKQRREDREREEQAIGVTLAVLQAARKGVQEREKVSFSLWDDAIVKGNLYPALHQLGRTIGKPELSKRLAELSISLADYNTRLAGENLTEGLTNDLMDELKALMVILENKG
jgi:hypothetical protein